MRSVLLVLVALFIIGMAEYTEHPEDAVITVSFSDSEIERVADSSDDELEAYDEEDVDEDDLEEAVDEAYVQREIDRAVYDPACKNSGGNPHCASWAFFGECSRNADYMLSHCEKSCYVCTGLEIQESELDARLLPLDSLAARYPNITKATVEVGKRLLKQLKDQLQGGNKNEIYKEKFAVGMQGEMFISIMSSVEDEGSSYVKREVSFGIIWRILSDMTFQEKRLYDLIHGKQFRRTTALNSRHGFTVQKKHMLVMRWQTLFKFRTGRQNEEYTSFAEKLIQKYEKREKREKQSEL